MRRQLVNLTKHWVLHLNDFVIDNSSNNNEDNYHRNIIKDNIIKTYIYYLLFTEMTDYFIFTVFYYFFQKTDNLIFNEFVNEQSLATYFLDATTCGIP